MMMQLGNVGRILDTQDNCLLNSNICFVNFNTKQPMWRGYESDLEHYDIFLTSFIENYKSVGIPLRENDLLTTVVRLVYLVF